MSAAVSTALYTHGAVDEPAFARFVAKTEASYRRAAKKAESNPRSLYHGWGEAECIEAARSYCGCYRHHFRVLVQIDPATRLPLAPAVSP